MNLFSSDLGQNLKTLKTNNLSTILSLIWKHEKVSRTTLSELTTLSPSSITRLTRELLATGLIYEKGKGKSLEGRQPILLAPNPNAGIVISFDLSGSNIRGGIFDSANNLLKTQEIILEQKGSKVIQNYIFQMMDQLLDDSLYSKKRLLGIGVSVPGVINAEKDEVSLSYNLQLKNFPLKKIIMDKYKVPVHLETDTDAAALTEKSYGVAGDLRDFIYLLVSKGIGIGIIKDNLLYQGNGGMKGKQGHIVIDPQGPLCICGKRGCLEAICGQDAILKNIKSALINGRDPIIMDLIENEDGTINLRLLFEVIKKNSQRAKGLLALISEYIAYAISLYTIILDINHVIIGGEVAYQLGDYLKTGIRQKLPNYICSDEEIIIHSSELKRDDFLKGINMLTIQEIIENLINNIGIDKLIFDFEQ